MTKIKCSAPLRWAQENGTAPAFSRPVGQCKASGIQNLPLSRKIPPGSDELEPPPPSIVLLDGCICLAGAAVPAYQTATVQSPPLVVGIPVFHQVPPLDEYHKLTRSSRRLRGRISAVPASVLLSLRSVFAFVVSKVDYISSGVYVTPSQYEPMAIEFRHTFRSILGLPKWTGVEFYALPLASSGAGCPSSPPRPLLQLLKMYQQASYCRNALTRRAVFTVLTVPAAFVEGTVVNEAARSIGLQVHVLPTPFLQPTPLHIQGSLALLHSSHRFLMVSTDGAYRPGAIGGGIIFYAPSVGILATPPPATPPTPPSRCH